MSYLNIRNTDTLTRAIEQYGKSVQVDMAIEEMSELTKALCKERRTAGQESEKHDEAVKNISEEIADVFIMLKQLSIIFDCESDIDNEIIYKIARLKQRLGRKTDE